MRYCTEDGIAENPPEVVRIEPASACNLRCVHCPTGLLKNGNRGVMSSETFETVLEEVRKLKPRTVVMYQGGEPFVNKNVLNMIRRVKSLGVGFVKTVTNGMLLKEEMLSEIVESGLDSITFSLDGTSPEENDEIRRGCNYRKVSSLIKQLIVVKRTLGSDTPEIHINNCQIPSVAQAWRHDVPVIPEYIVEDFSQYDEIEFKAYFVQNWPGFPIDVSPYKLSEVCNPKVILNHCKHPMELITICHNGDVIACCHDILKTYVLGNINRASISEIWNNEKYRTLRKSIYNREFLPLCRSCKFVIKPRRYLIWR